jgi:dTDP-4-dehydrorhamnose reductase
MLGYDLRRTAPAAVEVLACSRAELDVTQPAAVEAYVGRARPDVIINATGYTAVDRAEGDRAAAFAVNATAVAELAAVAARAGALLVHYSTDYVFDGRAMEPYREDAPTNPLNVYGASKLAGEQAIEASGARHLIIRTQWLFGAHGRSFPRTMLERAQKGMSTKVVTDQVGRPTYTRDVAAATWTLLSRDLTGTMHVANEGTATWFDVAAWVFSRLGVRDRLQPCTAAEYPTQATRPAWSVLDTTAYRRASGKTLPPWEDGLERLMDELRDRV